MKLKTIRKVEDETELEITGATLLSIEEAEALPNLLRSYTDRWWLRSPGYKLYNAAFVNNDGFVIRDGYYVDCSIVAVRPALHISNLNSSNLKIGDTIFFGDKEFKVVSNELAFCKTDIGKHCFREDYQAKDANDYEKSDVKKFIDEWFEGTKCLVSALDSSH